MLEWPPCPPRCSPSTPRRCCTARSSRCPSRSPTPTDRPVNALLGTANLRPAGRRAARPARRGAVLRRRGGGLPHRGVPALPRRPPADARRAGRASGPTRPRSSAPSAGPRCDAGDLEADDLLGVAGRRRARRRRPRAAVHRRPRHVPVRRRAGRRAVPAAARTGPALVEADEVRDATASIPRRSRTSSRCAATRPTACRAPAASARRARAELLREHGTLERLHRAGRRPAAQARRALKPRAAAALREQADELRSFRDIATLRPVAVERPADAPLDPAGAAEAAARARDAPPGGPSGALLPVFLAALLHRTIRDPVRHRCRPRGSASARSRSSRPSWPWSPSPPPAAAAQRGRARRRVARDGLELPRRSRRPGRRPGLGHPAACDGLARRHASPASWTTRPAPPTSTARSAGTATTFTAPARPPRLRLGAALRAGPAQGAGRGSTARRSAATRDPYVPFDLPARGLRAGAPNTLVVRVDSRKGAQPREGWWNWGGITRPVQLVPRGARRAARPRLPARRCRCPRRRRAAARRCCSTPWSSTAARAGPRAGRLRVHLRAPGGGRHDRRAHRGARAGARRGGARARCAVPVAATRALWSPDDPALYAATATLTAGGVTQQVERRRVGLRSVRVRRRHAAPQRPPARPARRVDPGGRRPATAPR